MLIPKKVKHRKWHKSAGATQVVATQKKDVSFGDYGLKAMTAAWVTSRQIEASRRTMVRFIKRGGKLWIRIFPDKPRTIKGAETPMGKGKGSVDHYVAVVRPGTVLFEISGVTETQAREAMRLASHKLPLRSRFVSKA